jgi:hypothetical protein
MFRTKAHANLTEAPHLNRTKEQFIEAYISDHLKYDYPNISKITISEHIQGILFYHRIANIVAPEWLSVHLTNEIYDAMIDKLSHLRMMLASKSI